MATKGHELFLKSRQDHTQTTNALPALTAAVGDDLQGRPEINTWEGQARFELAQLLLDQKKVAEARKLLNAIEPITGNATDEQSFRLVNAQTFEAEGNAEEASDLYSKYFNRAVTAGTLSETDQQLYLHAWQLAAKKCPAFLGELHQSTKKITDASVLTGLLPIVEADPYWSNRIKEQISDLQKKSGQQAPSTTRPIK